MNLSPPFSGQRFAPAGERAADRGRSSPFLSKPFPVGAPTPSGTALPPPIAPPSCSGCRCHAARTPSARRSFSACAFSRQTQKPSPTIERTGVEGSPRWSRNGESGNIHGCDAGRRHIVQASTRKHQQGRRQASGKHALTSSATTAPMRGSFAAAVMQVAPPKECLDSVGDKGVRRGEEDNKSPIHAGPRTLPRTRPATGRGGRRGGA